MRSRLVVLLSLALVFVFALSPVASAAPLHVAQAESDEGADQSDSGTDTGGGESTGEGDAEAEVGADEGQEEAAEEEEGPQWTYQMSRITLVMLLLLFVAMGALYYRMIAKRQGGA